MNLGALTSTRHDIFDRLFIARVVFVRVTSRSSYFFSQATCDYCTLILYVTYRIIGSQHCVNVEKDH